MSIAATPITMESLYSLLLEQSKQIERLSEMLRTLGIQPSASASDAPTKGRKKKVLAEGETTAEKPKRPLNAWFQFTARVRALIQTFEEASGAPKQARMPAMTVQMFASHLKEQKAYDAWTDEEITEALTGWEAPTLSKQAAKRAETLSDSGSVTSSAPSEPATPSEAAAPSEATAPTEKPKKAKKAVKKADEPVVAAPAPVVAPVPEPALAEKPKQEKKALSAAAKKAAEPAAEPVAEKPKKAKKQSKKAAAADSDAESAADEQPAPAPAPAALVLDLKFRSWTHNGQDYYKNERGDVISTEMEWVGLWNGKALNETAPEPEDLAEAEFADE